MTDRVHTRANLEKLKLSAAEKKIVGPILDEIANMRDEFNEMRDGLTQLINSKNDEIAVMHEKVSALQINASEKDAEINSLKCKVSLLDTQIKTINNNIDDAEAYSRRDCIILSGPSIIAPNSDNSCEKIAIDAVKNNLDINILPGDISTAHTLPAKNGQTPKIILKFTRRDAKNRILKAARTKRNNNIFANESLTPLRNKIFYTLRKMKRSAEEVLNVGTNDGKIFAYTKPVTAGGLNQRHLVNANEELADFCMKFVKVPLETFLQSQI